MFAKTVILGAFLLCHALAGQSPAGAHEALGARLHAAEQRIAALEAERDRLKALESRIAELERARAPGATSVPSNHAAVPQTDQPTFGPLTEVPYDSEHPFWVRSTTAEEVVSRDGTHKSKVVLTVVDCQRAESEPGKESAARPDFGPGSRSFRVYIEDLSSREAKFWLDQLSPIPPSAGASGLPQYRRIRLARVPTSQTHFQGYEGNSGKVHSHRGALYWTENNVFFLEGGALHILGGVAASFHVQMVRNA